MRVLSPHLSTVGISAATAVVVWVVLSVIQPVLRPEWLRRFERVSHASTSTSLLRVPELLSTPAIQSEDDTVIAIVKRAEPAVVTVVVKKSGVTPVLPQFEFFPFDPFEPFIQKPPLPRGGKREKRQIGGGSGFFVSSDGLIVTNKHVIDFEDAEFDVLTSDGRTLTAKVLGSDPVLDIAFLKVDGRGFPTLEFGDSDALRAGQTVIAIGNALGEFRNTVTKGVVSGLNRRIFAGDGASAELIEEAVQTDAAINPGNSGGPLLNLAGNVVGLNTAEAMEGQLIGFALPSNTVRRDLESIRKHGKIIRPFLGVRYQMITDDLVKKNQLKINAGALILRGKDRTELAVSPGSPAESAGLVENDIIVAVDGVQVTEERSLATLIGRHAAGDVVTLKLFHAGVEKIVTVTLGEYTYETH